MRVTEGGGDEVVGSERNGEERHSTFGSCIQMECGRQSDLLKLVGKANAGLAGCGGKYEGWFLGGTSNKLVLLLFTPQQHTL